MSTALPKRLRQSRDELHRVRNTFADLKRQSRKLVERRAHVDRGFDRVWPASSDVAERRQRTANIGCHRGPVPGNAVVPRERLFPLLQHDWYQPTRQALGSAFNRGVVYPRAQQLVRQSNRTGDPVGYPFSFCRNNDPNRNPLGAIRPLPPRRTATADENPRAAESEDI